MSFLSGQIFLASCRYFCVSSFGIVFILFFKLLKNKFWGKKMKFWLKYQFFCFSAFYQDRKKYVGIDNQIHIQRLLSASLLLRSLPSLIASSSVSVLFALN